MKNLLYYNLIFCLLFTCAQATSQNSTRPSSLTNTFILHQADSIKQELSKQGFTVVKEASMTMESEKELPVMVPLTEGSRYQFVFISDLNSRLSEVRMNDWNEKEVVHEKKPGGDVDGNIIRYLYSPQQTEYYLVKTLQVSEKKKHLFGYVLLLKKVKG